MTDDLIDRAKAALETAKAEIEAEGGEIISPGIVPDLIDALEARNARIAELERDVAAALRREDDANIATFGHLRRAADAEARVNELEDVLARIADADPDYTQWFRDIARAALEGEK